MTRSLALLLPLTLLACSGDDDDGTTEPSVEAELTVAPGPLPGIVEVTVTTSEDAIVELEYGLEDTIHTHPVLSNGGTEHTFTVLGLKAGVDYLFEASASAIDSSTRTEVVTGRSDPLHEDVPTFAVTSSDPGALCHPNGYVMFAWVYAGNSGVSIVDMDGDTVWSLPILDSDVQTSRARLTPDGTGLVYTSAHTFRTELIGEVVYQSIDGDESILTDAPTSHHDVLAHTDGTQAWLGYSFTEYDCGDGTTAENAALDTILEASPGGNETVVYDMTVDYPDQLDCDDGNRGFLPGRLDLTHSNSLMYRPTDDAYFVMSRWHDNLTKVDRSTGDVVWQLGGDYDDFTPAEGQDPADLFLHGHMSDIWDGGMLVFDNNDPNDSIVREYRLDEGAMTWEQVWSWETGAFEFLLGDAHRMPECADHVVVVQSTAGRVHELVQGSDAPVWTIEATTDNAPIVSRAEFIPDLYDLSRAQLPTTR